MRYSIRTVTAFAATLATLGGVAAALPPGVGPLTFEDQFEGNTLDLTKWGYRGVGSSFDGFVNPLAVQVDNGILKMKVYTDNLGVGGIQQHNTGVISTSKAGTPGGVIINPDQFVGFEQTYGYWEARVRFHDSSGTWSAFWLQSDTIGFPQGNPQVAGVEMDIFEHRVFNTLTSAPPHGVVPGSIEPYEVGSKIHMGLIWDGYPSPNGSNIATHNQSPGPYPSDIPGLFNNDPADTWHTAGLLWGPDGYTFFFDDVPIWVPPDWVPVSQRDQYIILSTHVWGQYAGAIPPEGYGTLETTTTYTEYDYVRVYALPEPAGLGAVAGLAALALRRRRSAI